MRDGHRVGKALACAVSALLAIASVVCAEMQTAKVAPKPRIFARVGDQPVSGPVGSAFVLPGERVDLRAFVSSLDPRFQVVASGGQLVPTDWAKDELLTAVARD